MSEQRFRRVVSALHRSSTIYGVCYKEACAWKTQTEQHHGAPSCPPSTPPHGKTTFPIALHDMHMTTRPVQQQTSRLLNGAHKCIFTAGKALLPKNWQHSFCESHEDFAGAEPAPLPERAPELLVCVAAGPVCWSLLTFSLLTVLPAFPHVSVPSHCSVRSPFSNSAWRLISPPVSRLPAPWGSWAILCQSQMLA